MKAKYFPALLGDLSRLHPSLDLYTYFYYHNFLSFTVLLIFYGQQCSFYTYVYIMPALKNGKNKNFKCFMNAWRPLLISTVWFRAGLPNKLKPLASVEFSWQQKKESHLTARLCWMPCLWLTTVSYLLQCMKWFRMRLPFWLCRICSLQSFLNAMHKLICFAGL